MNVKPKEKIVLTAEESNFIMELFNGRKELYEAIIRKTLGSVYQYLAEDTVSELYLLACNKIDILKAHPCPEKWLTVAARMTAQRNIQKHLKDLNTSTLDEINEHSCKSDVFEDAVYNIWLENKVPERLIAQLTKREQEIYFKTYIENKTPKDISKELNISENNVRNVNKNLKDKIRDAIKRKKF